MLSPERLSEIDEALDAFGIPQRKLARSVEAARGAKMSLAEVDAALESLAGRFETRVPEGALARSGSWARAEGSDERDAGSGLVEVDPATIDSTHLPAVLSERPPPAEDVTSTAETSVGDLEGKDGPATGQTAVLMADEEPVDPEARPSIEIMVDPADTSLRDSLFDGIEGTDEHGTDEHGIAEHGAAESERSAARESQAPMSNSALELELEGEPAPSIEQSSAKFSVPRDSVHPSPKSVIPPPMTSSDLDADLASILADELEPAPPPAQAPDEGGDELEAEATALFSADMFGAADEPSLAELISRPPPAQTDGDSDSLEIEIDDEVLVYEAAPEPPPTGTRPPPPGRSAPPPAKPGFLGRLLNRKP